MDKRPVDVGDRPPRTGGSERGTGTAAFLDQKEMEIRETELEIAETLLTLKTKLARQHNGLRIAAGLASILGRTKIMTKNRGLETKDLGHAIAGMVRENPVPAALIGVGLGWLIVNALPRPQPPPTPIQKGASRARRAWGTAREQTEQALGKAGRVVEQLGEGFEELEQKSGRLLERTQGGVERMMNEHPLGFGLAALAVGTLMGLGLPRTLSEDEHHKEGDRD
jgi:hypothetical protein